MKKAMLASGALYLVLFSMAAAAYPGGTHFDHAAVGHDFWRNTMCDVARTVALDGTPNDLGCTLARLAMTSLALGLGLFFWSLPRLMPSRARLGLAIRPAGVMSAVGSIAVVLLPTDRYGALHGLAIVLSGIPGLSAVALSVYGLARDPLAPRAPLLVGALALAVASADFVLYVRELTAMSAAQVSVAVLERIATILLLAWMASTAVARTPVQLH